MAHTSCMKSKWSGKKIKLLAYLLFVTIFVAILLLLTPLFTTIYGRLALVDFKSYKTTAVTKAVLDSTYQFNDLGERINMMGWAFSSTDEADKDKVVELLFKGNKHCYKVNTIVSSRSDVVRNFSDSYSFGSDMHGYEADFSTLCMANGTYDIYVYCRENDMAQGIAYLKRQMVKTNSQIEILVDTVALSEVVTPIATEWPEESMAKYSFDSIEQKDYYLEIKGWAFIPDLETKNQSVYLQLEDEAGNVRLYDTWQVNRLDVAEYYKNPQYAESGYGGGLPISDLIEGDLKISILIYNGNKAYKSDCSVVYNYHISDK